MALHYFLKRQTIILCLVIALLPSILMAQVPTISFTTELSGLSAPTNIANAGDGSNRLFITEQAGKIMVRNGPFLNQFADFGTTGANIVLSGGEQGLLGLAFHPQYDGTTNRFFYFYHTDLSGNIAITRCQTTSGNPNTADISTITNIITIPHPTNSNHNGGQLRFGPDGYLYFATGDGGGGNDAPNNAQTGTVLLGKMIRIDIDNTSSFGNYAVPADNPYLTDAAIDDRIWALGLRNPYRWSFDRLTGDMWIGDVGQGAQEEIDYRPAGNTGKVNYGWRCYEGYASTPGVPDCIPVDYVPPVYDYPNPASGSSSVTGGFVYRGTEYPTFFGRYIAADVYSGEVFLLSSNGTGGFDSTVQNSSTSFIVGFGEAEDGTLYAVSQGSNSLLKVVAIGGTVLPVKLSLFSGSAKDGFNELQWQSESELNTANYNIEFSSDGSFFTRAGMVPASGNISGNKYAYNHYINNRYDVYYRLAIVDKNGTITYSKIIKLTGKGKNSIRVYPTLVSDRIIHIELNGQSIHTIKLLSANGSLVYKKTLIGASSTETVNIPQLSKGIYFIQLDGNAVHQTEKFILQ